MKPLYLLVVIILSGCFSESVLLLVSSTDIPETPFSIDLDGPDREGTYHYCVASDDTWTPRPLGPLTAGQRGPATLENLGNGIFRIQWGIGSTAPYAIIDTRKEIIVEDSNRANPKNQPFRKRSEPIPGRSVTV